MDVSLSEAAQLANKSTRQIQRWIEDGKLTATKDESGHWRIDLASLGKVAPLDSAALMEIEKAHGLSLAMLAARIEKLEQQLAARPAYVLPPSASPGRAGVARSPRVASPYSQNDDRPSESALHSLITDSATQEELPAGSIMLSTFSEAHNVPRGTTMSALQRGEISCTSIDRGARDGRQERWASPADQDAIIAYWRRYHKPFHACTRSGCPCHETQESAQPSE